MSGHIPPRPRMRCVSKEAEQQCRVRSANEAISLLDGALTSRSDRLALRCECGDASCLSCVSLTRAEYEAVRAFGSHFAIGVNHEDPETACVLTENALFGVIDVVAGDARHQVLAGNPRHFWAKSALTPGAADPAFDG